MEGTVMRKAMIVAPHPDDAELAMGGSIAKMIEARWHVLVIDLTDGEPTPFGSKQIRRSETDKASRILGITSRICLEMPNRYLQANLENRRKLAEVIRLNVPDVIFGPLLQDTHPDHVAAAQLTDAACFEAALHKTDMKGPPHRVSKRYAYYSTHRCLHDRPSFIIDITDFWDKKIKAIGAYDSQIKNKNPLDGGPLLEKVESTCRYFGQSIGCKYAEPFVAHEPIALKSLDRLLD
ncbi:MAG: bacillithiol biosynthesis deacetylase BshB1 [Phycisphaerales bacterium]|nr:MAG: bacillithiol biosynthesis deacetylase BshB1 [Phycisphaerales bacterium]